MATNISGRVGVCAVVFAAVGTVLAPAVPAEEPIVYQPPVDAPVVDPFRPPAGPYGPGNRGLTYDLEPGTAVRAAADGTVVFSGPVAGALHVTVAHADGLRTSYSFLTSVSVRRGQRVSAGDAVGRGGGGFHFGVRDGDDYLDPAALFGEVQVRVRLLPDVPPPPSPADVAVDRRELRETVRVVSFTERVVDLFGSVFDDPVGLTVDALGELPQALRVRAEAVRDLWLRTQPLHHLHRGTTVVRRLVSDCTDGDAVVDAPAPGSRVAVTVAGYGSDGSSGAIDDVDTAALGYAGGDVVRFSYRGGRVPGDVAADLADIPASDYAATDTWVDLRSRGGALADLIERVATRRPGTPVDVYAHSQGGIVTRLALLALAERGLTDRLGVVVTIGTPHGGADMASAGVSMGSLGDRLLHRGSELFGAAVNPDAESVHQMAERSDLVRQLAVAGVPDGVDFRTVGARGDLIVPASRTTVRGEPYAVVDLAGPSAHDALPGHAGTTRELALALAGRPPACEGFGDIVLDTVVPEAITTAEDLVTALVPG